MGIEPTTYGLGGRRSTFELHGLVQLTPSLAHYKLLFCSALAIIIEESCKQLPRKYSICCVKYSLLSCLPQGRETMEELLSLEALFNLQVRHSIQQYLHLKLEETSLIFFVPKALLLLLNPILQK